MFKVTLKRLNFLCCYMCSTKFIKDFVKFGKTTNLDQFVETKCTTINAICTCLETLHIWKKIFEIFYDKEIQIKNLCFFFILPCNVMLLFCFMLDYAYNLNCYIKLTCLCFHIIPNYVVIFQCEMVIKIRVNYIFCPFGLKIPTHSMILWKEHSSPIKKKTRVFYKLNLKHKWKWIRNFVMYFWNLENYTFILWITTRTKSVIYSEDD